MSLSSVSVVGGQDQTVPSQQGATDLTSSVWKEKFTDNVFKSDLDTVGQ